MRGSLSLAPRKGYDPDRPFTRITVPLAYFITFSTYGTWLHGTGKGKGSVNRHHNQPGTPFIAPNASRESGAREEMRQPALPPF